MVNDYYYYKAFKLIGCKVNELPNGYFIVKKPDESESLIDNKGKVILSNLKDITQISEVYYLSDRPAKDKSHRYDTILFTKDGIVESLSNSSSSFEEWEDSFQIYDDINTTYYTYDGKAMFKSTDTDYATIIKQDGQYRVVYEDKNKQSYLADLKGSIIKKLFSEKSLICANNRYLVYRDSIGVHVVDYDNKLIISSNNTNTNIDINRINQDDTNIIIIKDDLTNIINSKGEVLFSKSNNEKYNPSIEFTLYKDIVMVWENKGAGGFLLDLNTMKRTRAYTSMNKSQFVATYKVQDDKEVLDIINPETLEVRKSITGYDYFSNLDVMIQAITETEYRCDTYTYDGRQLINEF